MIIPDSAEPGFSEALRRALAPVADPVTDDRWTTYGAIREALREDDPTLPRGIWERPLKRGDPALAAHLALDALERGKDVYVAGWLVEAWVRRDGFRGLRNGLWLLLRLCQEHWDALRPVPTEHDPDARDRAFERLDAHLPGPIGRAPLTADHPRFTWDDWRAALLRERHYAGGVADGPSLDDMGTAAAQTEASFYTAAAGDLAQSVEVLDALQTVLRERIVDAPPSLASLRQFVLEIHAWTAARLAERGGVA